MKTAHVRTWACLRLLTRAARPHHRLIRVNCLFFFFCHQPTQKALTSLALSLLDRSSIYTNNTRALLGAYLIRPANSPRTTYLRLTNSTADRRYVGADLWCAPGPAALSIAFGQLVCIGLADKMHNGLPHETIARVHAYEKHSPLTRFVTTLLLPMIPNWPSTACKPLDGPTVCAVSFGWHAKDREEDNTTGSLIRKLQYSFYTC